MPLKNNIVSSIFLIVYLFVGLFIHKDYGVSFDERIDRVNGAFASVVIASKFYPAIIPKGDERVNKFIETGMYDNYADKYHGVVFSLPMFILERFIIKNEAEERQKIFQMWHLFNFLLFFAAVVAFYFILKERFKDGIVPLFGIIFLVLSPRTFVDSFVNPKDIPLLSLIIISIYFFQKSLRSHKYTLLLLGVAGIFSGIVTAQRIIGAVLPVLIFAALLINLYRSNLTKTIKKLGVFTFFTLLGLFVFMPFLWDNPVGNLIEVFSKMKSYSWQGEVLFRGEIYTSNNLPVYYTIFWQLISVPIVTMVLFILGSFIKVKKGITYFKTNRKFEDMLKAVPSVDLIFFGLYFLPVTAFLISKPNLYDGWRHTYFTFAGIAFIATYGFAYLMKQSQNLRVGVTSISVIYFVYLSFWMIKNHPNQQVYFNALAGKDLRQKYELDYWGVSYKGALDHIFTSDPTTEIKIKMNGNLSAEYNLKPDHYKRFIKVEQVEEADYFITEYRQHPQEYIHMDGKEIYSKEVDGNKIISVFKLRDE